MHWRFIPLKNGKDKFGRTREEAFKEHALWCLSTLAHNEPDDESKIKYLCDNSITWISGPAEFRQYFAGEAVFNAYSEIKLRYMEFKQYYTNEERQWLESCIKFKNTTETV